jgi:hypothetical protein
MTRKALGDSQRDAGEIQSLMRHLADAFARGEDVSYDSEVLVAGRRHRLDDLVWLHGAPAAARVAEGARDPETDVLATLHCLIVNRNALCGGEDMKFWAEDMTEANGSVGTAVAGHATAATPAP